MHGVGEPTMNKSNLNALYFSGGLLIVMLAVLLLLVVRAIKNTGAFEDARFYIGIIVAIGWWGIFNFVAFFFGRSVNNQFVAPVLAILGIVVTLFLGMIFEYGSLFLLVYLATIVVTGLLLLFRSAAKLKRND